MLQEGAVVLGPAQREGYIRMMSTRPDMKKFEINKRHIDFDRDERTTFARKYNRCVLKISLSM